jgi:hypothetical protein
MKERKIKSKLINNIITLYKRLSAEVGRWMVLGLILFALLLLFNWIFALSLLHTTLMGIVQFGVSFGSNIFLLISLAYVLAITWATVVSYKVMRSIYE